MKSKVLNKILKIFCLGSLFLFSFSGQARAAVEQISDMLVGQTTVTIDGSISYYGGMGGNFAVLNYNGANSYGLNSSLLTLDGGCQNNNVTKPICFIFGSSINNGSSTPTFTELKGRIMTSRTYVTDQAGNKQTIMETPALFYGTRIIIGDTSNNYSLSNFAYWGRNLAQVVNGTVDQRTGATWSLGGYTVNNSSQSAWDETAGSTFSKFDNEIKVLAANASAAPATIVNSGFPLYLQNSTATNDILSAGTGSDTSKYPEGRVWVVDGDLTNGDFTLTRDISYVGTGTIIVKGNLVVSDGVKISPSVSDPNAKLGIIVLGNSAGAAGTATFKGNNFVNALIFCKSTFTLQTGKSNFDMRGAFIAARFEIDNSSNASFRYDVINEKGAPPGFRYLNIPTSKEKGNSPN